MLRFFEDKYYKVRDGFRYQVTENDLKLLLEIDGALNSILSSEYDKNTKEHNVANSLFLGDLVKIISFGFFKYCCTAEYCYYLK